MISMKFLFALLLILAPLSASNIYYGGKTLRNLKQFGVEVRVHCNKELKHFEREYREIITKRLERRGFKIENSSSVILKLFISAISSDQGTYVAHLSLQVHQGAYLGFNNKQVDAATWDTWKMGEYKELELLKAVDDLGRLFVNDYLQNN
jgi:dienelactone hydrolase